MRPQQTETSWSKITLSTGKHADIQTAFYGSETQKYIPEFVSHTKERQVFINNSLWIQFHRITQLLNSALKETKCAQEGSHLSVPRVLKDGIPGTTFGLWNMTVIFITIAPPLPEESSGRKKEKKSISSVVLYCWLCPSKVILQKKKPEKLIKLMGDTSKPLICCGHHFLFWDVLYGENYHPPPHQAVRSMFCIGLGVKDSHWPVKSVLSTPLNKFVWQFSTLQQLSVFRHI